jgi:LysM repeat protein
METPSNNDEKKVESKPEKPERRKFLKLATATATALFLDALLPKSLAPPPANLPTSNLKKEPPKPPSPEIYPVDNVPDKSIVSLTFKKCIEAAVLENKPLHLDDQTLQAIQQHWENFYSNDKNINGYLLTPLKKIRPWHYAMQDEFSSALNNWQRQNNITLSNDDKATFLNLIYLTIPESRFDFAAQSPVGAVGPFQFTESTAKSYQLTIQNATDNNSASKDYDERRDPVFSAKACANHLLDSYLKFGKSWEMATLDYNGGLTNKYNAYLQKINRKTEPIQRQDEIGKNISYTVSRGDTLEKIAHRYNTSTDLLRRLNLTLIEKNEKAYNSQSNDSPQKNVIYPGDILQIPQEITQPTYQDFRQWQEMKINQIIEEIKNEHLYYIVRDGDELSKIAKQYTTTVDELQKLNQIKNLNQIQVGQKIKTPSTIKQTIQAINNHLTAETENFNYPGKVFAIIKLIEELKNDQQYSHLFNTTEKDYSECKIKTVADYKSGTISFTEIINLEIKNLNISININDDDGKTKAKKFITKIKELNPAIPNQVGPLPQNAKIRIPII